MAVETVEGLGGRLSAELSLCPIELKQGSWEAPEIGFGDDDIIFAYSTAFGEEGMESLGRSLGAKAKDGAIVVCTEYELPQGGGGEGWSFRKLKQMDGANDEAGGTSTAYFYVKGSV